MPTWIDEEEFERERDRFYRKRTRKHNLKINLYTYVGCFWVFFVGSNEKKLTCRRLPANGYKSFFLCLIFCGISDLYPTTFWLIMIIMYMRPVISMWYWHKPRILCPPMRGWHVSLKQEKYMYMDRDNDSQSYGERERERESIRQLKVSKSWLHV